MEPTQPIGMMAVAWSVTRPIATLPSWTEATRHAHSVGVTVGAGAGGRIGACGCREQPGPWHGQGAGEGIPTGPVSL